MRRIGGSLEVAQVAVEVGRLHHDGSSVAVDLVEDIALPLRRGRQADEIGAVAEIGADHVAIVRVETARRARCGCGG